MIELESGEVIREELDVYERTERPSTLISDLTFSYRQALPREHQLLLELQVNNVFNGRTHTVPSGQSGVETGRNFWLSARYGF